MSKTLNEDDVLKEIDRWIGYLDKDMITRIKIGIKKLPSAQPEPCDLCSNLEEGDTLYQSSDWDGGIGFDYIRDIQFCPKCGRRLSRWI